MDNQNNSTAYPHLLLDNNDLDKKSTKQLLIKLFTEYPKRKYPTQAAIANALNELYGISRNQEAISKGFTKLLGHPFNVKGTRYSICKLGGYYQLLNESTYIESLCYKLTDAGAFKRNIIYYEQELRLPQSFILWIKDDEKIRDTALNDLRNILDDACLDIFYYEDKLIILLNYKSPKFPRMSEFLKNFFNPHYDVHQHMK